MSLKNKLSSGSVGLIGRPNVGKSTILNSIVERKISIVTRRPQTTRHRIMGIYTEENIQICFFDTPGYQYKFKSMLNNVMNKTIKNVINEVDVVVVVIDACNFKDEDLREVKRIPADIPTLLLINKIDLVKNKDLLLPFIKDVEERYHFEEIFIISALRKQNIKNLIDSLKRYIPTGTHKHSSNVVTDRGPSFLIAELIREQMFIKLGDEIPYGATVATESYENLEKLVKIKAIIVVEKKGHKAIVIGNKGETLKKIASPARLELQKHLMKKVFLEVWVKVQGGWTDSNFKLRELGF